MASIVRIKRFVLTPPKILVLGFAAIILAGSFLLSLPIATHDGQGMSWLNAFLHQPQLRV